MPSDSAPDFRQHLRLDTPEHVQLDLEIAGVGSRILAALIDWLIVTALVSVTMLLFIWVASSARWVMAVGISLGFAIIYGYFSLFEALRRGQTPGKRQLGIRVIRDTGHGVTLGDAAIRNLVLPIDLMGMIGVILIAATPRARRLGDMVAGTIVVRDRPARVAAPVGPQHSSTDSDESIDEAPLLDDKDFRLLRAFFDREAELPAEARDRLAGTLAVRMTAVLPATPGGGSTVHDRLRRLLHEEEARRRGRFGSRGAASGTQGIPAVAEQLVTRQATRWAEFETMGERVVRGGLSSLRADELPDFASRYRETAADLARGRTYGADPVTLVRLERMVAAGHNALYRAQQRTWRKILIFLFQEAPAAVVAQARLVLLAFLAFALPALAGFVLIQERPELIPELIPDGMLERMEAAPARTSAGLGYLVAAPGERPVLAVTIITNNIRVAAMAFAAGVLFGVGSLAVLAFNGLSIGTIAGGFTSAGVPGYLWSFIIGHGLLELFAIWVGGAAGFLLGGALLLPGGFSRADALVNAGRIAFRLVAAATLMLLVAGLIEGFVSASNLPVVVRAAVSAGSLLLLAVYLAAGAVYSRRAAASSEGLRP